MGYAHYTVYRRGEQIEAGYGVSDVCNADDCAKNIDRGLDFLCGAQPGGDEYGCGGYFCDEHLILSFIEDMPQRCDACYQRGEKQRREEFCEELAAAARAIDGVKDTGVLADKPEVLIDLHNGGQFIVAVS